MNTLRYSLLSTGLSVVASSLLLGLCAGCDDDRDDNPEIGIATEFKLNEPSVSGLTLNLEQSESVRLTWSQPNWQFPLACSYTVQIGTANTWQTPYAAERDDETGMLLCDYYETDPVNGYEADVKALDIAKGIAAVSHWDDETSVPEVTDVYLRVLADPKAGGAYTIASNPVKITVNPYYLELGNAPIEMWWLLGACIADGNWTADGVGVSVVPFAKAPDGEYNVATGQGPLTFTGYFDGGFKVIKNLGSWDIQLGCDDTGGFVYNDGGGSNISCGAAGYYTLTFNTAEYGQAGCFKIEPYEGEPKVYDAINVSGDFNSWGDDAMTALSTADCMAGHNHLWYFVLDATGGDTTLKFKIADSWDTNWGSADFPLGTGENNGANIPVLAGKWGVYFNDIDGSYQFIAL